MWPAGDVCIIQARFISIPVEDDPSSLNPNGIKKVNK